MTVAVKSWDLPDIALQR